MPDTNTKISINKSAVNTVIGKLNNIYDEINSCKSDVLSLMPNSSQSSGAAIEAMNGLNGQLQAVCNNALTLITNTKLYLNNVIATFSDADKDF